MGDNIFLAKFPMSSCVNTGNTDGFGAACEQVGRCIYFKIARDPQVQAIKVWWVGSSKQSGYEG